MSFLSGREKPYSRVSPREVSGSRVSFSIIAAIFLILSTTIAAGVSHQLHQMSSASLGNSNRAKYLVMLVLDGAQPSYFYSTALSHLDALMSEGTQYNRAFAGILESETPSGHAALATGSTPARDGLLGFNWLRSDNNEVRLFDPNVIRSGALERVMQAAGAPTIASLFKARYPGSKVVALSGHKYYAADPLGGPDADYIMYYSGDARGHYVPLSIPGHVPPQSVLTGPGLTTTSIALPPGGEDTLAVNLALHTFALVHQRITLVNLPEFDYPLGHVDGASPAAAQVLMQKFDSDLGRIEDAYRRAGVLDKTLFVITADHGMAPLANIVPDSVMDGAVTKAGATSPETTYSTAGYIWLTDRSKSQAVAANVVAAQNPHVQSVYYKVTTAGGDSYVREGGQTIGSAVESANQYLLSSFLGGNAPEVVTLLDAQSSFFVSGSPHWKGNHGGGDWESQHLPLLIAGAGANPGFVSTSPARLEDIAPTVLTMMGVNPKGMQGTVLSDAMLSPNAADMAAQVSLNDKLLPVVDALASQDQTETRSAGGR